MKSLLCAIFVLSACGSSERTKPVTQTPRAGAASSAALPGWLAGHWVSSTSEVSEYWVEVGGVLVGVGASHKAGKTTFFEVMLLHRTGQRVVFTAMPGGARTVPFRAVVGKDNDLSLTSSTNDHPNSLRYVRNGDRLTVYIAGSKGKETLAYRVGTHTPGPALEAADRAFAKDSVARGGKAWAERFETRGAMWPIGAQRTVGPTDIAKAIDGGRAAGALLQWAPSASAMSGAGDVGFTTGRYRIASTKGKTTRTGVYVTVWRRDKTGAWKIAFDTGVSTSAPL